MIGLFSWKLKILFGITFFGVCFASDYEEVYQNIPDICNPRRVDWVDLQRYINTGERPYLSWLDGFDSGAPNDGCRYDLRVRNFNFLGSKGIETDFHLHREVIHSDPDDKEQCIICYTSYNKRFPQKIPKMIEALKKSKFKGHFLYRIGGWPDVKGGSLKLIHVPYAFKVCMFKEAKSLGYKKVLWMDSSFQPLRDFQDIFTVLKREGYFITSLDNYSLRLRGSRKMQAAFGLTDAEMLSIREVAAGLIGVDFSTEIGKEMIDRWYKAAEELDPFLSPRSDQTAIGAIVYKMGLFPTCSFFDVAAIDKQSIGSNHFFYLGY